MAKCANCVNEAPYLYRVTPTFGIPYCSKHVPKFLLSDLKAGNLNVNTVEEVPAKVKAARAKAAAEEKAAPVEPEVEEPVVVEEPAGE